jgi:signal transduction histidine kinase
VSDPIVAWHVAQTGTLWGASLGSGLVRIDNPDAIHPDVETLGTSDGLPGERVVAITEDSQGRLYAGSLLGITRLDPSLGGVRHYSVEDGLARSEVTTAFRDRTGALWFGTNAGISRLVAEDAEPPVATRLLISGARVNGTALPIAHLGAASAGPFEFGAGARNLEVDFLSLGGTRASTIQYRLEGAEETWTGAPERGTVTYALLPSGSYRFVVRAPVAKGWQDASLAFVIKPPIWRRWWFVLSMAGLVAIGLLAAHRTRVARLVAVERVRTRIASDLHDDIGSNLSQIAILGELLQRKADTGTATAYLARIADLSRQSVDSLSDIVWSIDPTKDRLHNLGMRMRRLASDLLSSHDLAFTFEVHGLPDVSMTAEVRRDVFLAFKETLHNVVRHARCHTVAIDVRLEGGRVGFTVRDDGRGFDVSDTEGHGLTSVRRRADRLGGTLAITSQPGRGTTVELFVPLRPREPGER